MKNGTRFPDTQSGGRRLASALESYRGREDVIVVGIVRGGVGVAVEVASQLNLPMDVLLLRRLFLPNGPGAPLCVMNVCGTRLLDDGVERCAGEAGSPERIYLHGALDEFREQEQFCRRDLPPRDLSGRTVLLVDSGIRSGGTLGSSPPPRL